MNFESYAMVVRDMSVTSGSIDPKKFGKELEQNTEKPIDRKNRTLYAGVR